MDRLAELCEQFTHKLILAVGGIIGQVAGHQHRIRNIWKTAHRLDRRPRRATGSPPAQVAPMWGSLS